MCGPTSCCTTTSFYTVEGDTTFAALALNLDTYVSSYAILTFPEASHFQHLFLSENGDKFQPPLTSSS